MLDRKSKFCHPHFTDKGVRFRELYSSSPSFTDNKLQSPNLDPSLTLVQLNPAPPPHDIIAQNDFPACASPGNEISSAMGYRSQKWKISRKPESVANCRILRHWPMAQQAEGKAGRLLVCFLSKQRIHLSTHPARAQLIMRIYGPADGMLPSFQLPGGICTTSALGGKAKRHEALSWCLRKPKSLWWPIQ